MNKKTIAAFLGGIALTAAVFTTAPAVRDAVTPKVDAAGTCPITLQPIQSTGNLVFLPFRFYSSDLTNLRTELNDLGAWADGEISSINTEVTNGKVSLRTKMNSKGASLSTATIPTFAQLTAAVDDVYNEGFADGEIYKATHMNCEILYDSLDIGWNTDVSYNHTFTAGGTVYVKWRLHGDAASCTITRASGGTTNCTQTFGASYTVSAGDAIHIYQRDAMTADPPSDGFALIVFYN